MVYMRASVRTVSLESRLPTTTSLLRDESLSRLGRQRSSVVCVSSAADLPRLNGSLELGRTATITVKCGRSGHRRKTVSQLSYKDRKNRVLAASLRSPNEFEIDLPRCRRRRRRLARIVDDMELLRSPFGAPCRPQEG